MIRHLLWDVDGTLLDFRAAESAAVKSLFGEFSLGECTDEMVGRYSRINEAGGVHRRDGRALFPHQRSVLAEA